MNCRESSTHAETLDAQHTVKAVGLEGREPGRFGAALDHDVHRAACETCHVRGARPGMLGYASLGAAAAVLVVIILGLIVHRPLSQIPENLLKFVVGIMLTGFGVFWTGEGLGADWPGADWSLLAILVVIVAASLAAVRWLKTARRPELRIVR